MSAGKVWLKSRTVTVTLLTVPKRPETAMADG